MNETTMNIILLIFTVMGGIGAMVTLISSLFPKLFPKIGNSLIRNRSKLVISLLMIIITVQQVYIHVKL